MVPNGCADPTYSLVLQALLYTNPLLNHQDHDNLFGISKHEAQNHRFHNIQLMHQLKILEINGEMNEENFANTLLLFIDSDVVKSWSTLIDELSNSDFLQTGEKSQLVHLVEKFARNDNLEVFQPSGQTSTTSPSLHNELGKAEKYYLFIFSSSSFYNSFMIHSCYG